MYINILDKKVGENLSFSKMEHSLEAMQKRVGGYIKAVQLPMEIVMWLDEEGLLKEKPINLITYIEGEEVHHIVGDIFFTGVDEEGETISLNEEQMVWLTNSMKIIGKTKELNEDVFYFVYGLFID